jgi:hypothetical protein
LRSGRRRGSRGFRFRGGFSRGGSRCLSLGGYLCWRRRWCFCLNRFFSGGRSRARRGRFSLGCFFGRCGGRCRYFSRSRRRARCFGLGSLFGGSRSRSLCRFFCGRWTGRGCLSYFFRGSGSGTRYWSSSLSDCRGRGWSSGRYIRKRQCFACGWINCYRSCKVKCRRRSRSGSWSGGRRRRYIAKRNYFTSCWIWIDQNFIFF